jgi:hypothetical protein
VNGCDPTARQSNGCVTSYAHQDGTITSKTAAVNVITSGIAVDHDSTVGQASINYFSNLASASNAIKVTQWGLH